MSVISLGEIKPYNYVESSRFPFPVVSFDGGMDIMVVRHTIKDRSEGRTIRAKYHGQSFLVGEDTRNKTIEITVSESDYNRVFGRDGEIVMTQRPIGFKPTNTNGTSISAKGFFAHVSSFINPLGHRQKQFLYL